MFNETFWIRCVLFATESLQKEIKNSMVRKYKVSRKKKPKYFDIYMLFASQKLIKLDRKK